MKQICKLTMMLLVVFLWTGCTEEKEQGNGTGPEPGGETPQQRREVLLTLNNELVLKKNVTKAGDDPIATAEENAISSLDVYVFGCATEEGDYTFQEQFSYRADDTAELPAGATELDLTATDATNKQTKGLMKLKKGLFVKLYCIANCSTLIDPTTGNPVSQAGFVPLTLSTPEQAGTEVATEGKPMESEFISYHTPLLQADKADDILLTPLAMSGSYTIPLDLTDFETSARLQVGFKLTRLAARFDIINKADESRFTIKEVAMGNGRRGSAFFPIRVYGDLPQAKDGERIVYPVRSFNGDQANKGTQTGAFYSYPSPLKDEGYLILKGTYQVNKTDELEVSYRIPFTQPNDEGGSTALEINNNHRYTIAITEADDYHLDFTLSVADWADSGNIDDYEPGKDGTGTVSIMIPETYKDKTYYTEDTRTVSMYIKEDASNFDIILRSNAPVSFQSSYAGGPVAKEYSWLTIGDLTQTPSADLSVTEYKCNLSLVAGYDKKRYPKAILRFMNLTDGSENVVFVDALAAPSLDVTTQPADSHNAFDPLTATATLYRVNNSTVKVKLTCPDGVKVKTLPDWLEQTDMQTSGTATTFTFKLKERDVTVADNKGTITFCNANQEDWIVDVTVKLEDASSNPEFVNVGGSTGNPLTGSIADGDAAIAMNLIKSNTFTVNTNSLEGVGVEIAYAGGNSSPKWLSCQGGSTLKSSMTNKIQFALNETELAKGLATRATVTLKNISGGPDASFTVTPQFVAPTTESVAGSGTPVENGFDSSTNAISLYKVNNSSVKIQASSLGGNSIKEAIGVTVTKTTDTYASENEYTVQWDNTTADCSFKVVNKSDDSKETLIQVTMLDATITPTFSNVSGGNSCVDKTVTMKLVNGSSFKLKTASVSGVNPVITYASGGPQWLTCTGGTTKSASTSNDLVFNLDKTKITSEAKAATVTLKNLVAGGEDIIYTVQPEYQAPTATSGTSMSMQVNNEVNTLPTITIAGNCIGGSTIEGPAWLTFNKTSSDTEAFSYTVSINPSSGSLPTSSPGNQTITIRNKTKTAKTTAITVNITETMARAGSFTGYYTSESGSYTYRYTTSGGTITITAYSLFTAPVIQRTYNSSYCNSTNYGNSWLQSESVSNKIVNNRREYTFTIPVRSSSGTDAAYQLHKAEIAVKHNGNTVRNYTVWRGASAYGYWVGTTSYSGSPYYSALKKGSNWWAPVNCGAKRVPTSGSDTNGQGNLYQWGRKDETNLGSSTSSSSPISNSTPNNNIFYLGPTSPWDWLTPQNSTLWNGSSKGSNDPCPTGWRVPTISELGSLGTASISNKLVKISCDNNCPQLIFPAFGYRTRTDGTMTDTETAYSYSSNTTGVRAYDYKIGNAREETARTNAYPIRCIQQ